MPGKASKARYRAAKDDVQRRVTFAVLSGERENPFPVEDKRYAWFRRELHSALAWDDFHEDMCEVHGADPSVFKRRKPQHPGPVRPIAALV